MKEDSFEKFIEELQRKIEYEEDQKYSKVVISEYRNPNNFGDIKNSDASGKVKGPCGDTMKINLKIDYLTRSEDQTIVITDWKTGNEELQGDNLQVGIYTLWCMNKFEYPVDKIKAELIFLRTGKTLPISLTMNDCNSIKEKILAEASEIMLIDSIDDFIPTPRRRKCVSCQFAIICQEGKKIIEELLNFH